MFDFEPGVVCFHGTAFIFPGYAILLESDGASSGIHRVVVVFNVVGYAV